MKLYTLILAVAFVTASCSSSDNNNNNNPLDGDGTTTGGEPIALDVTPQRLLEIVNGESLDTIGAIFDSAFINGQPDRDDLGDYTVIEIERDETGLPDRVRFACAGGGEYEKPAFQGTGLGGITEHQFSNCMVGNFTYNGLFSESSGVTNIQEFKVERDGNLVVEATGSQTVTSTTSGNQITNAWDFSHYYNSNNDRRIQFLSATQQLRALKGKLR